MNSLPFPAPASELKPPRASAGRWAAALAEERRRLDEDQRTLRERETNLREYEARLRAWQAEIDAQRAETEASPVSTSGAARTAATTAPFLRPSSRTPFADVAALQGAWEKLHRARELLEAEQLHLRDDRTAMRDREAAAKQRESALAQREAVLAEREALIAAALAETPQPVAAEHTMGVVTSLTRSPFEAARTFFKKKAG